MSKDGMMPAELDEKMIRRVITVNCTRTPQDALKATGRNIYCNDEVVTNMPKGEGYETVVFFFKVGRWLTNEELEVEYHLHGLKPADPYSLAAVNENDAAFADKCPNCTQWKDEDGKWCFASFDHWGDGRGVYVRFNNHGWDGGWWFAGLAIENLEKVTRVS